ncbi:MAG: glucuronate isomerase [Endomicrobium sp.]|jgi:glucuronate isomerase|nr:glucuronate isomerase [Endomicrobium sp.]
MTFIHKEKTMKNFINNNFLLSTKIAKKLFHEYASKKQIVDYHCHLNPREIAQNMRFKNMSQLWLNADHYKWRLMRSNGIEEKYITGNASDREKFQKWIETLEKAIGNPIYHWSHLELKKYFDYDKAITGKTAQKIWELCNEKLKEPSMSAQEIIKQSKVKIICTTDDPVDTLEWHKKIRENKSIDVKIIPTWRPDKAFNIEQPIFIDYINQLSKSSEINISSFADLKKAFKKRLDFFISFECRAADHAMEYVPYSPATEKEIEIIFEKKLNGNLLTKDEELKYKTAFMIFAGQEYHKNDLVMELHYGCSRNNNASMFKKIGADTGYDCINDFSQSAQIINLLNALSFTGQLPRTIIFNLNPNDNSTIGTILGCFQEAPFLSKIQQGAAWWFNDHKNGILDQLISTANLGILSNFIGMLTDSRSFLSYVRHEYFRRILCNLIGNLVKNGEYPYDIKTLSKIVCDISYNNAIQYFKFNV